MHETGHEEVQPAVVVVVKKPAGKAEDRQLNVQLLCKLCKGAIMIVPIEKVLARIVGHIEIRIPVTIVIARHHGLTEGRPIYTCEMRNLAERTVAVIMKELRGRMLIADKKVQKPIIIKVSPHRALSRCRANRQPGLAGNIGERAVAVVPQKRAAHGIAPAASQNMDVQPAVIVVIGLEKVEPSQLTCESGLSTSIREAPITVVMVVVHRLAVIPARNHNVQKPIIVEIIDN